MISRTNLLGLAAFVATLSPVFASAQSEPVEQLQRQFELLDESLLEDGFYPGGEMLSGYLKAGESESVDIWLDAPGDFKVVGVCDNDCSDVDMVLFGPGGEQLVEDLLVDDVPVLEFQANASGNYRLEIRMVTCSIEPCFWGAQRYSENASGGGGRTVLHEGELGPKDETLSSGEYVDRYPVEVTAGQRLTVDLRSDEFDPYLMLLSPSGEQTENDDWEGSVNRARIELVAEESGTWEVVATAFTKGLRGGYQVEIVLGSGAPTRTASGDGRVERGELGPGDDTLPEGEYADIYKLDGHVGDVLVLDLTSSDFDTYVVLVDPNGEQQDNDDYEGDARRSMLGVELESDGEYTVVVTSYAASETGAYRLEISQEASAGVEVSSSAETIGGALTFGDDTLESEEYVDVFTFQGRPGDVVRLDLRSPDFDTYLILLGPDDFRRENDDGDEGIGHSMIEVALPEYGEYTALVTSFEPAETGDYSLVRTQTAGGEEAVAQRDVEPLQIGGTGQGTLELGDGELESGEWRDLWVFDGESGQNLVAEVSSSDFDTYIMLVSPDGQVIDENDDADGEIGRSRLDISLRDAGRYRLVATTFSPGESGRYEVSLRDAGGTQRTTNRVTPTPSGNRQDAGGDGSGGKVYGVFVGISDYGGRANDLPFTADDARRAADAMAEGAGMSMDDAVVLTDRDATVANMRDAFEDMGRNVGPEDTFVFFYSGHGARIPRNGPPERADPDGLDETIELFDETMRDNEFSDLLGLIDSELSMVILDACFSGGFSKDVISEPGRIGFFSSEEDVTSQVASKFRAGGYLAQFFFDGVGDRLADIDGDGTINAIELSQYLHDRYRFDVKSANADEYVRTSGPQSGFQHLVVDRGSIGPYDAVFR
jgi:Caspase domain